MVSGTELRILEAMFDDLTKEHSVTDMARVLKRPYAQIHKAVKALIEKKLVSWNMKGKSLIISLNLAVIKKEYIFVELLRKEKTLQKYKNLAVLEEDIQKITPIQFTCLIFGSYAKNKAGTKSDIDLLFVIPEEYNYGIFEKTIKNNITLPLTDINITTEKGLLEMWQKPGQLNVGNELLKAHIILKGAEAFLNLRRKYYAG